MEQFEIISRPSQNNPLGKQIERGIRIQSWHLTQRKKEKAEGPANLEISENLQYFADDSAWHKLFVWAVTFR
jgi:hypothetical protein